MYASGLLRDRHDLLRHCHHKQDNSRHSSPHRDTLPPSKTATTTNTAANVTINHHDNNNNNDMRISKPQQPMAQSPLLSTPTPSWTALWSAKQ